MKQVTLALAKYTSSVLPKVLTVKVKPSDIDSSETFLKAERKVNEKKFQENKNYFIKYKLPRFFVYIYIRDGYRRIKPEQFFSTN